MMTRPNVPRVPSETRSVRERLEEALREIGVLLLAFTPLDATLNRAPGQPRGAILYFVAIGLCLFGVAILMEHRRRKGSGQ